MLNLGTPEIILIGIVLSFMIGLIVAIVWLFKYLAGKNR